MFVHIEEWSFFKQSYCVRPAYTSIVSNINQTINTDGNKLQLIYSKKETFKNIAGLKKAKSYCYCKTDLFMIKNTHIHLQQGS